MLTSSQNRSADGGGGDANLVVSLPVDAAPQYAVAALPAHRADQADDLRRDMTVDHAPLATAIPPADPVPSRSGVESKRTLSATSRNTAT